MHTKPMAESDGELSAGVGSGRPCQKCRAEKLENGSPAVRYQTWESSCGGYEDYKYTCGACGHVWWIDGIDS
jgi:hypothetical protein